MRIAHFAAVVALPALLTTLGCGDEASTATTNPSAGGGAAGQAINPGGGTAGGAGIAGSGGAGGAGIVGFAGAGGAGIAGAGGAGIAGAGGAVGGGAPGAATMNLSIAKKGVEYPFDRAQFGLTKIAEGHEVYVEAHFGGDPACPTQSSPSPDRTLIITGLLAEDPPGTVVTQATFARANLLDFKGDISSEPIVKSVTVELTSLAGEPCPTCAAEDPARFVSFAIEATLTDGSTVVGTVRATHCGSLDQ